MMNTVADVDSPPMVPPQEPIDFQHLARMTMGERSLEVEVLALFDGQALVLLARMRGASPAATAAFAHTLKGSATGVGAWRVAAAAAALEQDARACRTAGMAEAVDRLAAAIEEAHAAIAHQREVWKLEPHDG